MAFKIEELERMAGGGAGFALWGYASAADNLAAVGAEGYFSDAGDMLRVNDWLFIMAGDGGGLAIVKTNSGGVVTLTDVTAIGGVASA